MKTPVQPPPRLPLYLRLLARLLRLFFHLLYHPFAWAYDFVAATVSLGQWNEWVNVALRYIPVQGRVLELGHGPGHLQLALAQQGAWVTGLDRSRQMGQIARRRLRRASGAAGRGPALVNGLAQTLPYAAESFTQVVATFPTEYLFAPQTLAEVYRVLQNGGSLVVLPTAWITGKSLAQRAAAGLFRITGQSPEFDQTDQRQLTEPFRIQGFETKTELVMLKGSTVFVIIAEKTGRANII